MLYYLWFKVRKVRPGHGPEMFPSLGGVIARRNGGVVPPTRDGMAFQHYSTPSSGGR